MSEDTQMRRCTSCHIEKQITDFSKCGGGYRRRKCKVCDSADQRLIYANNPEKERARVREYNRAHADERRESYQRWHAANQERRSQYYREYNEAHREEQRAYDRIRHSKETPEFRHTQYVERREYFQMYGEKYKDRKNATTSLWAQTFPEKRTESQQRRRARKRNAPRIEKIDRMALIERDNWTCYLCGCICTSEDVTLDHVVPLSKGGSHTADNLRVACLTCNLRKGAKLLDDFIAG